MSRYAKSIVAFLTALKLWTQVVAPHGIHGREWWGLIDVAIATFGVYLIPNTPPAGEPSDPAISETDPPARTRRAR